MENQNLNPTNEQAAKDTSSGGNGKGRNHHRRHHRPNRPRPEGNEGAPVKESVKEGTASAEQKPAQASDGAQKNGNSNHKKNARQNNHRRNNAQREQDGKPTAQKAEGETKSNGKNDEKNNKSRNDKRKNDRRDRRKGNERGPYNPYEEPSADELSLAELRARIVLNASGNTPTDSLSSPGLTGLSPTLTSSKNTFREETPEEEINVDHILNAQEAPMEDESVEKVEIVGIRFRASGKMYYFDPHGIKAKRGQHAIVETARGPEFGDVCLGNTMINAKNTVSPLRPILRIATKEDIAQNEENRKKEDEALRICKERVAEHKLDMKLVDVQYAFDGSKLLFYFTADGRVDFRELVKDLASVFRTRIELRQIGIRDEAKMLGGLGACGRALCCSTFLPDFAQVSIKMAKEQSLSLNSSKISGLCGRLMCCLKYESDVYSEEIRRSPSVDALVKTEDGIGNVISVNPLAGTVRVIFKDKPDVAPKQYHRSEITMLEKEKKSGGDRQKSEKDRGNDQQKAEKE